MFSGADAFFMARLRSFFEQQRENSSRRDNLKEYLDRDNDLNNALGQPEIYFLDFSKVLLKFKN